MFSFFWPIFFDWVQFMLLKDHFTLLINRPKTHEKPNGPHWRAKKNDWKSLFRFCFGLWIERFFIIRWAFLWNWIFQVNSNCVPIYLETFYGKYGVWAQCLYQKPAQRFTFAQGRWNGELVSTILIDGFSMCSTFTRQLLKQREQAVEIWNNRYRDSSSA